MSVNYHNDATLNTVLTCYKVERHVFFQTMMLTGWNETLKGEYERAWGMGKSFPQRC